MLKKYLDDFEIGIDEAGRGPLMGRVYAGAVVWGKDTPLNNLIIDSKKLSEKKRAIALDWIKKNVAAWGIGWAEPEEIDTINILEATKLAINRAIINLKESFNIDNIKLLIIDGNNWENKFLDYESISVIKGDNKYLSIAAASILAKEYHDEYIKQLCIENIDLNEKYCLLKNKGYGTKNHIDGIHKYGLSKFHRLSYKLKANN
jgi:ribonuclease HII|uniref:Ribonuclease HII n=1 Tax=viral metagenome TaxID=1070528 RepID=A0A6C0EDW8_9ZZZZ